MQKDNESINKTNETNENSQNKTDPLNTDRFFSKQVYFSNLVSFLNLICINENLATTHLKEINKQLDEFIKDHTIEGSLNLNDDDKKILDNYYAQLDNLLKNVLDILIVYKQNVYTKLLSFDLMLNTPNPQILLTDFYETKNNFNEDYDNYIKPSLFKKEEVALSDLQDYLLKDDNYLKKLDDCIILDDFNGEIFTLWNQNNQEIKDKMCALQNIKEALGPLSYYFNPQINQYFTNHNKDDFNNVVFKKGLYSKDLLYSICCILNAQTKQTNNFLAFFQETDKLNK